MKKIILSISLFFLSSIAFARNYGVYPITSPIAGVRLAVVGEIAVSSSPANMPIILLESDGTINGIVGNFQEINVSSASSATGDFDLILTSSITGKGYGVNIITDTTITKDLFVDGLLGIGTNIPSEKLHVNGNILSDYGVIGSTGTFNHIYVSSITGTSPLNIIGGAIIKNGNLELGVNNIIIEGLVDGRDISILGSTVDQIQIDTTTLRNDLSTETFERIAADNQIAIDTTTLRNDLNDHIAYTTTTFNEVAIDTTTLRNDLEGYLSYTTTTFNQIAIDTTTLRNDLSTETSERIAADNQIAIDTTTLRNDLNDHITYTTTTFYDVGLSTTSLYESKVSTSGDNVSGDINFKNAAIRLYDGFANHKINEDGTALKIEGSEPNSYVLMDGPLYMIDGGINLNGQPLYDNVSEAVNITTNVVISGNLSADEGDFNHIYVSSITGKSPVNVLSDINFKEDINLTPGKLFRFNDNSYFNANAGTVYLSAGTGDKIQIKSNNEIALETTADNSEIDFKTNIDLEDNNLRNVSTGTFKNVKTNVIENNENSNIVFKVNNSTTHIVSDTDFKFYKDINALDNDYVSTGKITVSSGIFNYINVDRIYALESHISSETVTLTTATYLSVDEIFANDGLIIIRDDIDMDANNILNVSTITGTSPVNISGGIKVLNGNVDLNGNNLFDGTGNVFVNDSIQTAGNVRIDGGYLLDSDGNAAAKVDNQSIYLGGGEHTYVNNNGQLTIGNGQKAAITGVTEAQGGIQTNDIDPYIGTEINISNKVNISTLNVAGESDFNGNLDMNDFAIQNIDWTNTDKDLENQLIINSSTSPINDSDLTAKKYVDDLVANSTSTLLDNETDPIFKHCWTMKQILFLFLG